MKKHTLSLSLLISAISFAQVGISTQTPKATLDIVGSPSDITKVDGVIAPRVLGNDLAAKDALYTTLQTGAIVYVTGAVSTPTAKTINVTSVGYYYFDGTVWIKMTSPIVTADNGLTKTGNNIQLGGILFKNTEIATSGFDTTFTGSGRIGIGTNNPFSRLSNSATVAATDNSGRGINTDSGINWTTSGGAYGMILSNSNTSGTGSGLLIKTNSSDILSRPLHVMSGSNNILTTTGDGKVGINLSDVMLTQTLSTLDVNGDVRIRPINTNVGNSDTDKLVVADANGVLKTIAKPNPLLTGGTLADVIATAATVTATAGAPDNGAKVQSLINYTFTLDKRSLVTFNYQLSFSVTPAGLTNAMKIVRSYLAFTAGSLPLNQQFGYQSTPHSAITGRPGFFYHNASESLVMQPGTYTVQLYGNVLNTTTASDPDFAVVFGDGPDRFTVTAMPVY